MYTAKWFSDTYVCVCVCVYIYIYTHTYMYVCVWKWKSLSHVQLFVTPWSPWNSLGQNTGVGSHSLLQGIFPTWGSNPGFPHCRQILYQLSHQGSSRILEWVVYPFSSGYSWPRNWTRVSCIAGGFLPAELPGKPYQWPCWYTKKLIQKYPLQGPE